MEDKPNSRAFHDLEENHVEIPQHIKNILTQMGFIGLRAFSRLKPNDLKEIENGVRSILAGNAESMTPQEKLNVFGKAFASKPDQFQFLPGDKTVIEVISDISKKLVDAMPPVGIDETVQNPKKGVLPKKAIDRYKAGIRVLIKLKLMYLFLQYFCHFQLVL